MELQEHQGAAQRSFRMARSPGRAAAGIAAAVAVVSFTFLVFGRLSDQRVFDLAGARDASHASVRAGRRVPPAACR